MTQKLDHPPGCPWAVKLGCTCPVESNHNGQGAYVGELGDVVFMFDFACPLHGDSESVESNMLLIPIEHTTLWPGNEKCD